MKIKRLKIGNGAHDRGYKNFLNTTIEFNNESNYCILIGINGSGKSNLLEAVSKIFRSLYLIADFKERVDFDFELTYQISIDTRFHEINITFLSKKFTFKSDIDGKIKQVDYKNYLPTQIISNYSGEESRLWEEIYFKFYEDYTSNVRELHNLDSMKMLYLNKYNWDMALITLLCLEDEIVLEMLGMSNDDINDIYIIFKFDTSRYPEYYVNPVIAFIDDINPDRRGEEDVPLVNIKINEVLQGEGTQKYINLFNYLYVAYMPKRNKIITDIDVKFNNFNARQLSEGQKKMLLVRLINHLSKNKESLILLDEPDSHIHVSRKKDLANTIRENNQFTIITSHSPTLINEFDEKYITMLIPSEEDGVEIKETDSFEHIKNITDNSFSLLDTSLFISTQKHILMCEGINDLNYIRKALEVLNRTQDNKYQALNNIIMMNCGGADNVPPVFKEIVKDYLSGDQICVTLFDYDDSGKNNKKTIDKLITEEALTNVKTAYHPHTNEAVDQTSDPDKTTVFLMENYFPVDTYKSIIISDFQSKNDFKSLSQFQNPKSIISKKYQNFNDVDFNLFSILFNKLLKLFGLEEQ